MHSRSSLFAALLMGCGGTTSPTPAVTSTDAGSSPAIEAAVVADTADTASVEDTHAPPPVVDAAGAPTASLVGKVTRKAGTKPSAGGKGHLYIAVFDGNPITDTKGAKLVARTLIENVDMSGDATVIDYRVDGIPLSSSERQVVAFLDDNKTATAENPAPDKGDLVTIEIPAFSGVKVKVEAAGDKKLDLALNAAIP